MNGAAPRQSRKLGALLDERFSWGSLTLFGESVPHLLHWDWAYFWIISRQSAKPRGWDHKIEAWKRLLCMLLLGELQLDTQEIQQPLLSFTQQVGLTRTTFIRAASIFGERPIAVFSPIVIIRPLPDPNRFEISAERLASELPKHYDPSPERDRRPELIQVLDLAKGALRRSGSELAEKLIALIDTNLKVNPVGTTARTFPVVPLAAPIPILKQANVSAWEQMRVVPLDLVIPQGGAAQRLQFVPRCVQCGDLLTVAENVPAIDATTSPRVSCRNNHEPSPIDLRDFGVWQNGETVYVWRDLEQLEGLAQYAIPPKPEVSSEEIRFRWNPALLGGESVRVNFRLRFPRHQIQEISVSELKYSTLLVAGDDVSRANALPIRPEWLFAFERIPDIEISREVIAFPNAQLRGLRYPVTLGRYPRSATQVIPDFQVGMFPGPLYEGWKRYRFFWSGSTSSEYESRIVRDIASPVVATGRSVGVHDWREGLPQAFSIQSKARVGVAATVGATWLLKKTNPVERSQPIIIGIDFGTTNTVAYIEGQDTPYKPLELKDFLNATELIAGQGVPRATFLPLLEQEVTASTDPTLVPSALWYSSDEQYQPVRWIGSSPADNRQPLHGFKWKQNLEIQRRAYLDELLFLTLPTALKKLFPDMRVRGNWNIGFAFPLAFSDAQRSDFARLLKALRSQIDSYTSGPVEVRTVNESYACVRAFGEQLHGTVFLIADLGGGSLDVALFEVAGTQEGRAAPVHYQIGSAKIGGETFVTAISNRLGSDDESRERQYWRVRDAIMRGRVSNEFSGSEFGSFATRFLPIAQELLRNMVSAFVKQFPDKQVKVVLVGNGWRISEFTANTPLAAQVGRRDLEDSFADFAITALSPYKEALPAPAKHLVAVGALKNARPGGHNEIEAANESKLPSGLTLEIINGGTKVDWFSLVGPAVRTLPPGTGPGHINIERSSGAPTATKWGQVLNYTMPNFDVEPSDSYIRESLKIAGERLEKGPLQVILEWRAEELK